jgi:hypothetical protein
MLTLGAHAALQSGGACHASAVQRTWQASLLLYAECLHAFTDEPCKSTPTCFCLQAVVAWHAVKLKGRVLRKWHFAARRATAIIARAAGYAQNTGMQPSVT